MSEDKIVENENSSKVKAYSPPKNGEFKFFKDCSASLKRLSVIMFVINLFFAVSLTIVACVLIAVYSNLQILSIVLFPIITVFVIMVIIARCISAFIYGFAEIVEKNQKG